MIWAIATTTIILLWEKAIQKKKYLNEGAWKDIMDTLHNLGPCFKTYTKCNMQVNNICEAFNKTILEHRDKPIITLLEWIKHYITKWIIK